MASCLIGIGSNLGDRAATIRRAVDLLGGSATDCRVVAISRLHETRSIGGPDLIGVPGDQPAFLNAALLVESSLSPPDLMRRMLSVESQLGRERDEHWGARTIDLDLLLYDELVIKSPELTLPHPRMALRRFVLEPAAEIAPEMVHPTIGWTISRLLDHIENAKPYVALTGAISVGKTALALEIRKTFGGQMILEPIHETPGKVYHDKRLPRAWEIETTFLRNRRAAIRKHETERQLAVSDFWIEQSLAFASLYMSSDDQSRFADVCAAMVAKVQPPKLLVVLDAPAEFLIERVRRRGRPYQNEIDIEWINRLREAITRVAARPGIGPTLWLDATDVDVVHREVFAAIQAMA